MVKTPLYEKGVLTGIILPPFPGKKEMPFWNDGHSGRGITVIQSVHFTGESAFFIIEEENTAPVG